MPRLSDLIAGSAAASRALAAMAREQELARREAALSLAFISEEWSSIDRPLPPKKQRITATF